MIYHTLPDRRSDIGDYVEKVRAIVNEVRQGGDNALIKLTERLDGVKLSTVKATKEEIDEASAKLPHRIATDIDVIFKHLYDFHSQTKPPNQGISQSNLVIDLVWEPIRRVGIYVPKGRNSYPSTLLMTGVPAIVAGVDELYVASAPSVSGLDPAVAYISKKMGVREIYRLGGPQAIAAMAFGTESVAKVDKIVGPGGLFVQAAKLLVSQWVGIDGIEGPTELVIVADESADSRLVAHDLLAQAEHGPNTVLVLLSTSEAVLKEVERAIQSSGSPENGYHLVKVSSLAEAIDLSRSLSPEHLSLHVKDAEAYVSEVRNAGIVTLGDTPPALVDYCAGPSHVLPTSGWARFRGGLSIYDFLKQRAVVRAKGIEKDLWSAAVDIANYEGFMWHGRSIGARYE